MVALNGFVIDAPIGYEASIPTISTDLDVYDGMWLRTYWPVAIGLRSPRTRNVVVAGPHTRAGKILHSFFNDFYFRIYYQPTSINLGNVLGTQQRIVALWNAWPYDAKSLSSAEVVGDSGTTVEFPPGVTIPHTFRPLQELEFRVVSQMQGPPNIDAAFEFTVSGVDYRIRITGRRIVLFPFEPNWRTPVDETITFNSWVITSGDGTEQTGSGSGNNARRSFEYSTVLKNEKDVQLFENLAFAWQSRFFGVPVWPEERLLVSEAIAGATALAFDTTGFTVEEGSLVVLWRDKRDTEIKEVSSVTAAGIVVSTPLDSDWGAGDKVYPLAVAILPTELGGTYETSAVGRVPLVFECEPLSTFGNTNAPPPAATYKGDELYLGPLNWQSGLRFAFQSDRKKIDFGTAKFSAATTRGYSRMSRSHNWTMFSREEVTALREFLGRRQGVARPVWMPSGKPDFTLIEPVIASMSTLVVEPNDYEILVAQNSARRHVFIRLADDSYLCRKIQSSSLKSNGLELVLDQSHGVDLTPDNVRIISMLDWCRLESPAVTVRHLAKDRAIAESRLVSKKTTE